MKPTINAEPVSEMSDHLKGSERECVSNGWWGAKFSFRIAGDIWQDVLRLMRQLRDGAHRAEQADLHADTEVAEATAELEAAVADGEVNNADAPRILRAMDRLRIARRHIKRSATLDHNISDATRHVA